MFLLRIVFFLSIFLIMVFSASVFRFAQAQIVSSKTDAWQGGCERLDEWTKETYCGVSITTRYAIHNERYDNRQVYIPEKSRNVNIQSDWMPESLELRIERVPNLRVGGNTGVIGEYFIMLERMYFPDSAPTLYTSGAFRFTIQGINPRGVYLGYLNRPPSGEGPQRGIEVARFYDIGAIRVDNNDAVFTNLCNMNYCFFDPPHTELLIRQLKSGKKVSVRLYPFNPMFAQDSLRQKLGMGPGVEKELPLQNFSAVFQKAFADDRQPDIDIRRLDIRVER